MATIQKRQLAGRIQFTLVWQDKGKRKRKSLGFVTEIEAKKTLLQFELDMLNNIPESVEVPLFEDYADQYLSWHAGQHLASYERVEGIVKQHLIPCFEGKILDKITMEDVEQYQMARLKTKKHPNNLQRTERIKPATVNKEVRQLKAMLTRAVNLKIITISPINALKKIQELNSKSVGYFTREELELIYSKAFHAHWWRLLANTVMRLGEARNLKWAHVKNDFIEIESLEGARTKSGKWRMVPIGSQVRKALLDFWRKESGDKTAKVYPKLGGHVFPLMRKDRLTQAAKRAITAVGLPGSAHKFRHTYISLLAMEGVPMGDLQILAGHSSPAVTDKYRHLSPDYLRGYAKHC